MNWAYGVEFLAIDPKQLGTDSFDAGEDEHSRQDLQEEFKVDKNRLRGLHAILLLLLALTTPSTAHHRMISRDRDTKRKVRAAHPCPSTREKKDRAQAT